MRTYHSIGQTPTGWMNNKQATNWLHDVFIPYTMLKCIDTTKPIVLILDGHELYENSGLKCEVYLVAGCDIIIFCFLSKCTHCLQPLNVVIFSLIGWAWCSHCDDLYIQRWVINCYNVVQEYVKVQNVHMNATSIKSAFWTAGLYPVNCDVFSDKDFAPSMFSSTAAHVLMSFPDDIPTSPISIPDDINPEGGSEGDTTQTAEPTFVSLDLMSNDDNNDGDYTGDVDEGMGTNGDELESEGDDNMSDSDNSHEDPLNHNHIITTQASLLAQYLDFNNILVKIGNIPCHVDEAKSHEELFDEVWKL